MKKSNWIIVGSIFSVLVIVVYYTFYDYLQPRTPLKIARIESGLDIPKSAQVVVFNEQYSFTGEGFIYVLLKLEGRTIDDIIQECLKKRYKKLTVENLIDDQLMYSDTKEYGCKFYNKDITTVKEGYYKLNAIDLTRSDFSIVVIDKQRKELMVYVSFP